MVLLKICKCHLVQHVIGFKWYMKDQVGTKWPKTGRKIWLGFDEKKEDDSSHHHN